MSETSRRAILAAPLAFAAMPKLRVSGMEMIPVRATGRTVWLMVRLRTDSGLTGLGEASDAFGFAGTSVENARRMESELRRFYQMLEKRSPIEVERFRQHGEASARSGGLVSATAYSAIEQALWDLTGKALNVPVHAMFGGAVRTELPMYANINRATSPRSPTGFAASAKRAVAEGYRAIKAAPWDGFPPAGSSQGKIRAHVDQGIACTRAIREAVGPDIKVMVDCHSFFTVPMAVDLAGQLEPYNLTWYEEPVAPKLTAETLEIRKAIRQEMAGGEMLFGVDGFTPLCRDRAVHVIMPDVKHCGGLLEMTRIAAMAGAHNVSVAPHNPAGPVSTAASVQVCAGMKNFNILEVQWGEVPWRGELLDPPERIVNGTIRVPDAPGFGVKLNDEVAARYKLS